jgi:hypothetical protein
MVLVWVCSKELPKALLPVGVADPPNLILPGLMWNGDDFSKRKLNNPGLIIVTLPGQSDVINIKSKENEKDSDRIGL